MEKDNLVVLKKYRRPVVEYTNTGRLRFHKPKNRGPGHVIVLPNLKSKKED